ncbi:hypothetical protein B0H12DRAFT_1187613 [Mycena haematopus]|nr:hypothetical protein B0H12DRAFT_1187613 [Mycena haematopus]
MPTTCSICFEPFTSPVSLPCGHVFCRECIRRTVNSIKSYTVPQCCPACRAPYSVLTVDPAVVPPHLRLHMLPAIRPVFFDDLPAPRPATSSSTSAPVASATPPDSLRHTAAEVNALQMECAMWRRRAETHAAANTSLLGFVRAAKDCAVRLRADRDAERSRYVLLKRKFTELMPEFDQSTFTTKRKHEEETAVDVPLPRVGLPVFVMQCKAQAQHELNRTDMDKEQQQSLLGPPIRRRCTGDRSNCNPAPLPLVPRPLQSLRRKKLGPTLPSSLGPVPVPRDGYPRFVHNNRRDG